MIDIALDWLMVVAFGGFGVVMVIDAYVDARSAKPHAPLISTYFDNMIMFIFGAFLIICALNAFAHI